jgi:hypothetical protein
MIPTGANDRHADPPRLDVELPRARLLSYRYRIGEGHQQVAAASLRAG